MLLGSKQTFVSEIDVALVTSVYRKKTNRGLLLHYQSHFLSKECTYLKAAFLKLKYPERLIDSTISRFNHSLDQDQTQIVSTVTKVNPICIILHFKDQILADIVRRDFT